MIVNTAPDDPILTAVSQLTTALDRPVVAVGNDQLFVFESCRHQIDHRGITHSPHAVGHLVIIRDFHVRGST